MNDSLIMFCSKCPNIASTSHVDPETKLRMVFYGTCAQCDYWGKYAFLVDDPNSVRAEGRQYFIGPEPDPRFGIDKKGLGFGGEEFTIRFYGRAGRVARTRNLWTQGEIPERFREMLPDNADIERQ